jgi:hypothetical protein
MLIGLLLGMIIGLLIAPVLRSWLTWRQYVDASREARRAEEVLRRMSVPPAKDLSRSGGSSRER